MKPIKLSILGALAGLVMMALVGGSSALATETALCASDQNPCGSPIDHTHLISTKMLFASSVINVKCDVLFLGTVKAFFFFLIKDGKYTFSNCTEACTVKEEGVESIAEISRTGHETASAADEFEIRFSCGFFINCVYNGEELQATVKGPLLSTEANGEAVIGEQVLSRVSGFCPETAKLTLVTTSLTATYITKGE